jgi:hypothetical protein
LVHLSHLSFSFQAAPIEEVSDALYDKGVKFLVTHDMEVKLPEIMFDGARFRISPRAIEGNGIIAKLEYIPKSENEGRGIEDPARLFKKKISKYRRILESSLFSNTFLNVFRKVFQEESRTCGSGSYSDR